MNADFQAQFFPGVLEKSTDNSTSPYCKYDDQGLQAFVSSLFLAGAFAAVVGSYFTTAYGRRPTMVAAGTSFFVGAVLCCSAVHIAMLIIGRIFLGTGVGLATQSVPLFLSEVAPFHLRGALNCLFQFAIVIGIVVAQLINYFINGNGTEWGWRLSLGLAMVPAAILAVGSWTVDETPNSLIERSKWEEAKRVLQRIRGTKDVDIEYEDICAALDQSLSHRHFSSPWAIFERRYRPQLVCVILIPMFQQLTGINAIIFYSPQLFAAIGASPLLNTVIVGAVNAVATIVAIGLVDLLGRKVLFLQGGVQMLITEVAVGVLLAQGGLSAGSGAAPAIITCVCLFVAGFAWSWGPLAWLVPTEICPMEIRSSGQAINVTVNFLFTFAIGQAFLSMLCGMQYGIFFFFGGWVAVMSLFVLVLLPETRGQPIEEVGRALLRRPLWAALAGGGGSGAGLVAGANATLQPSAAADSVKLLAPDFSLTI